MNIKIIISIAIIFSLSCSVAKKDIQLPCPLTEEQALSLGRAYLNIHCSYKGHNLLLETERLSDSLWSVYRPKGKSGWKVNDDGDSILTISVGGGSFVVFNAYTGEMLRYKCLK